MRNYSPKSWEILSNHETFQRLSFAIGVHEDRHIIVAGGNDYVSGSGLKSVVAFDMKNRTVTNLPDLPEESWTCTGAILRGYFYTADNNGSTYRLDLSTYKRWEELNPVGDITGHSLVSNGKCLYSFGGIDRYGNLISPCNKYDPDKNTWTELPQMNVPRYRHAAVTVGNQIYVIGGLKENYEKLSSVEVYDIASCSWRRAPDLPFVPNEHSTNGLCLSCASATHFNGFIIVTGGRVKRRPNGTKYCFVFNTNKQKWIQSPLLLPTPRGAHGCAMIGGSKFINIGGQSFNAIEATECLHFLPNWTKIRHWVLLRKLVEENRAFIKDCSGELLSNSDYLIQKLITNLTLDLFRYVISFLI